MSNIKIQILLVVFIINMSFHFFLILFAFVAYVDMPLNARISIFVAFLKSAKLINVMRSNMIRTSK